MTRIKPNIKISCYFLYIIRNISTASEACEFLFVRFLNKPHLFIYLFKQATRRLRERDASQCDSVATVSADDDEENPDDSEGENRKQTRRSLDSSHRRKTPFPKHTERKVTTAADSFLFSFFLKHNKMKTKQVEGG